MYQKAYVEFFASPEITRAIFMATQKFPSINFYAVDSSGVEINSHGSSSGSSADIHSSHDSADSTTADSINSRGGVTALTWGVFPNKEILQPTIFDHDTFIVWSKEGDRDVIAIYLALW